VSTRARVLSFGSAALLVVIGAVCAAAVGGGTGQMLGLALVGLGLVLATGLVFLEVGLSEDHQRARDERGRTEPPPGRTPARPLGGARLTRPNLGRSRDHPRRLK
jgi:hypothetical protein